MITQQTLSSEFDLAKRIYIYYLDKLSDYVSIGSDKYISWYKDLCILYFLTDYIQSLRINTDKLYIGNTEVNEDSFAIVSYNIREFITNDIRDIIYVDLDSTMKVKDYSSPIIPPTIVTYQSVGSYISNVIIKITEDDIAILTVPFNIANVDINSVKLTVNDGDPMYVTDPLQEGFHIVGTNLHWHSYYNLKINDILQLEYLIIA